MRILYSPYDYGLSVIVAVVILVLIILIVFVLFLVLVVLILVLVLVILVLIVLHKNHPAFSFYYLSAGLNYTYIPNNFSVLFREFFKMVSQSVFRSSANFSATSSISAELFIFERYGTGAK